MTYPNLLMDEIHFAPRSWPGWGDPPRVQSLKHPLVSLMPKQLVSSPSSLFFVGPVPKFQASGEKRQRSQHAGLDWRSGVPIFLPLQASKSPISPLGVDWIGGLRVFFSRASNQKHLSAALFIFWIGVPVFRELFQISSHFSNWFGLVFRVPRTVFLPGLQISSHRLGVNFLTAIGQRVFRLYLFG